MAILIYNVDDLQGMNNNLEEDYELVNDIDASYTVVWNQTVNRGNWQQYTDYYVNECVHYERAWHICRYNHTSGYFLSSTYFARVSGSGDNDLGESAIPAFLGFQPIANVTGIHISGKVFTGSLDGKGHKMRHCRQ